MADVYKDYSPINHPVPTDLASQWATKWYTMQFGDRFVSSEHRFTITRVLGGWIVERIAYEYEPTHRPYHGGVQASGVSMVFIPWHPEYIDQVPEDLLEGVHKY
jgi:hypothetical protein